MKNYKPNIVFFLIVLVMAGCSPFKYIPENSYLLDDVKLKVEKNSKLKEELIQNISQKPNRKFLGVKFHMFLYRLSNPKKEKGYFKEIGEEPVVWDSYQTKKSTENFKKYLDQNGYFNSIIDDTISYKKKRRVEVSYHIIPGKPYKINRLIHHIEDSVIYSIVRNDSVNSRIKPGDRFMVSEITNEKLRVQKLLLDNGYYDFIEDDVRNYITFGVDTSLNKKVNINVFIKNPVNTVTNEIEKFQKYRINNVYIFRNFKPADYINEPNYLKEGIDTLIYDSIYFLSKKGMKTNPGILSQSTYILPGELFNQQNENLTSKHLRSLRIFQNVEINYINLNDTLTFQNEKLLDCFINLTPMVRQFYQIEASITNTNAPVASKGIIGSIGAESRLRYQYKNLFGNAEILDFSLSGAAESLFRKDSLSSRTNSVSFGVETRLHIPKFLVPVKTERFIKKYSPQTSVSLSYKYYNLPDYNKRNTINTTFGYNWIGNKYTRHAIDPIRLNYVNIDTFSLFNDLFDEEIKKNPHFFESLQDKMITSADYTFEFNNEGKRKSGDFAYLRYNIEVGGNILYGINKLLQKGPDTIIYKILGVPFSQFVKMDIDFRFYDMKANNQSLVYRIFFGVASPYGNSTSVPFEKRYAIGGSNSMRAWQADYLGPGTSYNYPRYSVNARSDIKMEFNFEYRFDIFWVLKGALFVDAGNLWSLSTDQGYEKEGISGEAGFELNRFYKEIALGSGIGFRLDWDFIILRFDLGLKIHDPTNFNKASEYKWLFRKGDLDREDWNYQIGIAYPF